MRQYPRSSCSGPVSNSYARQGVSYPNFSTSIRASFLRFVQTSSKIACTPNFLSAAVACGGGPRRTGGRTSRASRTEQENRVHCRTLNSLMASLRSSCSFPPWMLTASTPLSRRYSWMSSTSCRKSNITGDHSNQNPSWQTIIKISPVFNLPIWS